MSGERSLGSTPGYRREKGHFVTVLKRAVSLDDYLVDRPDQVVLTEDVRPVLAPGRTQVGLQGVQAGQVSPPGQFQAGTVQGLADPGSERAISMICQKRSELIEITREGIDRLDAEAQILLWKNVARLLMRQLSLCLYQESFQD